MVKLTKRKGFNFFRSYYDVYNELQTAEDKVAFIDALLDRQFLGIKPTNLQGMAKFAYISQTNSIDSQVKGYEDKTGIILTPCQGGAVGGADTPCLQVQEKEKEKVKDNKPHLTDEAIDFYALLDAYNKLTGKNAKVVNDKTKRQIKARFKEGYTKDDLWEAMVNCSKDPFHIEKKYNHFTLEFISRSDKLDKYLTAKPIKENLKINDRL
jgi:uncharacterized phage protein (TIGR02220 family)